MNEKFKPPLRTPDFFINGSLPDGVPPEAYNPEDDDMDGGDPFTYPGLSKRIEKISDDKKKDPEPAEPKED